MNDRRGLAGSAESISDGFESDCEAFQPRPTVGRTAQGLDKEALLDRALSSSGKIELLTERLRLRMPCKADFEDSAAMWAEEETVRHISGRPSTPFMSWARLLRHIGHWHAVGYGYWTVETRDDRRFLGEIGFGDFKRGLGIEQEGLPEAGWVMRRDAAGQGYASEAVAAMLNWADANLSAASTYCLIAPENAASRKLAGRFDYREVGATQIDGSDCLVLERSARR